MLSKDKPENVSQLVDKLRVIFWIRAHNMREFLTANYYYLVFYAATCLSAFPPWLYYVTGSHYSVDGTPASCSAGPGFTFLFSRLRIIVTRHTAVSEYTRGIINT